MSKSLKSMRAERPSKSKNIKVEVVEQQEVEKLVRINFDTTIERKIALKNYATNNQKTIREVFNDFIDSHIIGR